MKLCFAQVLRASSAVLLGMGVLLMSSITACDRPRAPENFTATYNSSGADAYVELHWDSLPGVEYEILRGPTAEDLSVMADSDEGWYDDFDFTYEERFYAVRTKGVVDEGLTSDVVEANIPAP